MREFMKLACIAVFLLLMAATASLADCRSDCRENSGRDKAKFTECLEICKMSADAAAYEEAQKKTTAKDTEAELLEEAQAAYVAPDKLISWKKIYEIDGEEYAVDIDRHAAGGYVIGGHANEQRDGKKEAMFMVIDDAGEKKVWKTYNAEESQNYGFAVSNQDAEKSVLAVDAIYPPDNNGDIILLTVDNAGEILSETTVGLPEKNDDVRAVIANADGSIVLSGMSSSLSISARYFVARLKSDSQPGWSINNGTGSALEKINSLQRGLDGGYIAAGLSSIYSTDNSTDMIAMKISDDGTATEFCYNNKGSDAARSAAEVEDGAIVVVGSLYNSENHREEKYVLKYRVSDNEVLWKKRIYTGYEGYLGALNTVKLAPDGNYLVCGTVDVPRSRGEDDTDNFVFKIAPDGKLIWMTAFGDEGIYDSLNDCEITPDGKLIGVGVTGAPGEKNVMVFEIDDSGL